MYRDYHHKVYDCSVHCYAPSGKELVNMTPEWKRPGVTTAAPDVDVSFIKRRTDFAQMQLDQLQRLEVPVFYGDRVVSVAEEADRVVVTTEAGRTYRGDVCVGASGIGSMVPGFDAGPQVQVQDSGYAVARAAFPRGAVEEGSPASSLLASVDRKPEFRTYVGKDLHLILFLTADWVGIAFTHPVCVETIYYLVKPHPIPVPPIWYHTPLVVRKSEDGELHYPHEPLPLSPPPSIPPRFIRETNRERYIKMAGGCRRGNSIFFFFF